MSLDLQDFPIYPTQTVFKGGGTAKNHHLQKAQRASIEHRYHISVAVTDAREMPRNFQCVRFSHHHRCEICIGGLSY